MSRTQMLRPMIRDERYLKLRVVEAQSRAERDFYLGVLATVRETIKELVD